MTTAQDLCGKILAHELVDVEAKDREGKTALHIAAERGYVMMCQRIIAQPRINLKIQRSALLAHLHFNAFLFLHFHESDQIKNLRNFVIFI